MVPFAVVLLHIAHKLILLLKHIARWWPCGGLLEQAVQSPRRTTTTPSFDAVFVLFAETFEKLI